MKGLTPLFFKPFMSGDNNHSTTCQNNDKNPEGLTIGYKNTQTYLLQYRDNTTEEVVHKLVEAGSTKDAERELRKNMDDRFTEGKVVTSIKSNGDFGDAGHGELHGENHDLEEIVEELQQ